MARPRIPLVIVNRSGRSVPKAFLQEWVALVAKQASAKIEASRFDGRELTIAFVTKAEIKRLNKTYRGIDKPTDVLSFEPIDEGALGELAISPEVISKQAREHGLLVREELGYMVLHGILHLLGYDHETHERDAKKMFTLQDAIFDSILKPGR
jgi:probable rRNA maturation factor